MAQHIFNEGDRVQDSRNPSRKGTVVATDIVEHGGSEAYSLDYANDGYNGWSDWPYQIKWEDQVAPRWEDSEYAEPEDTTYVAPEGTAVEDILKEGTKFHFVRSDKPVDELEPGDVVDITSVILGPPVADVIDPDYYKFPSGVEVIDISRYLTGNGAQVVQYVARSTRLDGKNKGDQIENLRKARWFLENEIARLEAEGD